MVRGRPRKPDLVDSEIRLIENYAGRGATLDDIAAVLGWSASTLDRRLKDTPEIEEAYRRGRAIAGCEMRSRLWDIAMSDGEDGAPTRSSITATIFYLKTQCGWGKEKEEETQRENVVIYLPENGRSFADDGRSPTVGAS